MSKNILDYRLVILDNNAKIFTDGGKIHLSLSHSHKYATAFVVIEK